MTSNDSVPTAAEAAAEVRALLEAGSRFVWCYADVVDGDTIVRYVVDDGRSLRSVVGVVRSPVPSLNVAAAAWHERALVESWNVELDPMPTGGSALQPQRPEDYRIVESPEVSTVLYGPIRSGISESARWIIETAGEDFVAVAPSFGYKARSLEARFVGTPLELAPFVAEHVSGATAASHATAFARAVEAVAEVEVPLRARAIRSILVELERVHQHLDALAKLADDGSLAVGSSQAFAAKERIHRLLAEGVGNRFGRGVICAGGVRFDALVALQQCCTRLLDTIEHETVSVVDALLGTPSLVDRLVGTGRLTEDTVRAYGGVGPVARGSGVACDARARDGWIFADQEGDEALAADGDALARAHVRRTEIRRSFQLIRNALDAAPPGSWSVPVRDDARGESVVRIESPQGELLYAVRLDNGIRRVAIRSASFQNWPLFAPSLPGNIFTDFSFIEHSFGLIFAETDR